MAEALEELAGRLLILQGDGDRAAAGAWCESTGAIGPELRADLERLDAAAIPVDVFFNNPPDL